MAVENSWNNAEALNQPSGEQKVAACAASHRLSENVAGISKDNSDINYEMNNGRVECYPPPITPRCQWQDIPPNPAVVDNRINDMINRQRAMHSDLSQLSPLVASDPKLARGLDEVNNRLMALEMETNNLYNMTVGGRYNEDAISKETRTIEKLTKNLEGSRRALARDLGCDSRDLQDTLVAQDHETVSCDVAMKPKQVWKQIGKFDALPWHPGIESGSISPEGDVRKLIAGGGSPVFTEQLLSQGEDRKTGTRYYTYQITEGLPVQPISTLRVEPHGKGSRITWQADMDLSALDDETAAAVTNGIKGFHQQGLSALMEKLNKK